MCTTVDASVPADRFALAETFDAVADAEFESVRVAAHPPERPMPLLWGSAADRNALSAALAADSSTANVQQLASRDERCLYRVDWDAAIETVLEVLVDGGGTVLGTKGTGGRWAIQLLFPDHDSVSTTFDACAAAGVDLSIRRVNGVTDSIGRGGLGLSADQHEALRAAFETDYYAVPRGMTLEGLAGELDVSHQALSERLRRGHRNLIANTLFDAPEPVQRTP